MMSIQIFDRFFVLRAIAIAGAFFLSFMIISPHLVMAQGGGIVPGRPIVTLYKNGKVTTETSIDVQKVQEYSLTAEVLRVNGYTNQYWEGTIVSLNSENNTVKNVSWFSREPLPRTQVYKKDLGNFKACSVNPGIVTYRATYSYDETGQNIYKTDLQINFTGKNKTGCDPNSTNSDPTKTDPTKTDPTKTDPTKQTPADTGPKGKDNKDINTDVTFKCDPSPCNFDTPLGSVFNPLEDGITVPGIIVRLINILLMISGTVAVGFIIFGGLMMVTSAGNESRVTKGKQTVIYAVAGLVVSILSFSIVAIIQSIIN